MVDAHGINLIAEELVRFGIEQERFLGTYKALVDLIANRNPVVASFLPQGTKGFTHMLKELQPWLEERGVRVRVDGKLKQRLRFLVVKLDVVPTVSQLPGVLPTVGWLPSVFPTAGQVPNVVPTGGGPIVENVVANG